MDENKKESFSESQDIFDDFKSSVTKSDEITEITSKKSSHSKEPDKKNVFSRALTAILGLFVALFYVIKKRVKPEYLLIFSAIIVTLAVLLVSYFVFFKEDSYTEMRNRTTIVENYVKKVAVYDYDSVKNTELVETKKLVELVEKVDFEQFCSNRISNLNEITGEKPKIKTGKVTFKDIEPADRDVLGYFLKHEFGMTFTAKDLEKATIATVNVTKTGKGQSIKEKYALYLVKDKIGDSYEWKIIDSAYVEKYAENNGISVPERNDFAKSGEDFFK